MASSENKSVFATDLVARYDFRIHFIEVAAALKVIENFQDRVSVSVSWVNSLTSREFYISVKFPGSFSNGLNTVDIK